MGSAVTSAAGALGTWVNGERSCAHGGSWKVAAPNNGPSRMDDHEQRPGERACPPRQQRGDGDHDAAEHQDPGQLDQARPDELRASCAGGCRRAPARRPAPCSPRRPAAARARPAAALTTWLDQPPRPADGGGEDRLQRAVGLLGAHAQQHLDDVDRDGHAGHLDDRGAGRRRGSGRSRPSARTSRPSRPRVSSICSMTAPKISPNPSKPTAQPSNAPRCSRQTSPNGLSSRGRGLGVPASLGEDAAADVAPGRRACPPRPTSATKATANRQSGHQWSPPNGRICWPHPIGDSHAGQALTTRTPLASTVPSMLPMPLTRNASPSTAAARPLAPRVVEESCTVTAATPANTMPTAPTATPAVNEPAAGCPVTIPARPEQPRPARCWRRR